MQGASLVSLTAQPSHPLARALWHQASFMVSDRFSLESTASTFMSLNRMGRKDLGVEKPVFFSQRRGIYLSNFQSC